MVKLVFLLLVVLVLLVQQGWAKGGSKKKKGREQRVDRANKQRYNALYE